LADGQGLLLPASVLASDLGPGWARWRAGLERLAAEVLGEWDLRLDGPLRAGLTALVLPVRDAAGRTAALKLGWPHTESEHEHLVLRAWAGRGAVRLLRADPARSVLLLERADAATDLTALPAVEACAVVGELYGELHRPALPQLQRLSRLARDWAGRLRRIEQHPQVARRFVVQALAHLDELADAPTTDGTLVHTDLHYANVLASLRVGPPDTTWLAIDPKPLSGDPAYEVAPLLWNRADELRGAGGVRDAILDRFFAVVDAAGLDEDRARAWVVVRGMVNVLWAVEDADRARPLDRAFVTFQTTMIKAMIP
jgi:streptomycin 6-kinase